MRLLQYVWPAFFSLLVLIQPTSVQASSAVVISQVYGGGGNAGASLKNDFVELFNRSTTTVSVDGWTIQYASATGSSWDRTALTGSIPAGGYYLIALAAGTSGTANLPSADIIGVTNLSATTGKIALVNNNVALGGSCPTGAVDFVGYGGTNCSEGSSAPALTNTTALLRASNGCTDGDSNSSDFATGSPSPRNSSSTRNTTCAATSNPSPPLTPTLPSGPFAFGLIRTIGDAPLIFPHYAQGGGYQTTFTFNNLSTTTANISLSIYSQAGALINSTTLAIAGYGSARTAMTGSTLSVGWARASVSPAVDFVGTETMQLFNGSGALIMEASVLAAQPDTTLRLPVFEKDGFGTGVALMNASTAGTTATLTLRNSNGTVANTAAVNLSGSQQTAKFVSELFPGLTGFEGMLEVAATRPLAGLALRQNFASGIFSTLPVTPSPTEAYFSPKVGIASRIVQEIQAAQTSIDIAIYSFTRDEIADALIAAKGRGVQIRIVADSSEANGTGAEIGRLEAAGFQLKRTNGGGGGIMHNKVAIFDGHVLLTGSYNWSTAAESDNDENAVFIRDGAVVAAYQLAFNTMWSLR